jgi:hypothetical protein
MSAPSDRRHHPGTAGFVSTAAVANRRPVRGSLCRDIRPAKRRQPAVVSDARAVAVLAGAPVTAAGRAAAGVPSRAGGAVIALWGDREKVKIAVLVMR